MRVTQRELANNIRVDTLRMKLYIRNQATLTRTSVGQLKEKKFEKKKMLKFMRG